MSRCFPPSRRRIVDLSIPLDNSGRYDPPPLVPEITCETHGDPMPGFLGRLPCAQAQDFPDGQAAASEKVHLSTHSGTHLDAPWHFHATMNAALAGPRPSATIALIPLDWCLHPGIKLDFRPLPDGHVVTAAEVAAELDQINITLQPLNIILINTSDGARQGKAGLLNAGCGMGRAARLHLLEPGIRLTGTDG